MGAFAAPFRVLLNQKYCDVFELVHPQNRILVNLFHILQRLLAIPTLKTLREYEKDLTRFKKSSLNIRILVPLNDFFENLDRHRRTPDFWLHRVVQRCGIAFKVAQCLESASFVETKQKSRYKIKHSPKNRSKILKLARVM